MAVFHARLYLNGDVNAVMKILGQIKALILDKLVLPKFMGTVCIFQVRDQKVFRLVSKSEHSILILQSLFKRDLFAIHI